MRDALAAREPGDHPPFWVIAAGKAASAMARAAVEWGGARVRGGVVISPDGDAPAPLHGIRGEHPQPGRGSEEGGRRALAVAAAVPHDAELLTLISGGASSLMAAPVDDITLHDKREATGVLLRSGADIYALNTVRKHLSAIKGGRLATACRGRHHAYVLSDVVGDDLSVIASGPTVPDPSTFGDALFILDRFGGRHAYPDAVVSYLVAGASGDRPESPKPGDPRFASTRTILIGSRVHAMRGAADEARRLGYDVRIVDDAVVGEARLAGPAFVERCLTLVPAMRRPSCIVASGETTVRVIGRGSGGRNQEFALAAAETLARTLSPAAVASAGTDGVDGPTDAAGAFVDGRTVQRGAAAGLPSIDRVLAANDAYYYLQPLGLLIRTGPTGTNVGDLQVFLLA